MFGLKARDGGDGLDYVANHEVRNDINGTRKIRFDIRAHKHI